MTGRSGNVPRWFKRWSMTPSMRSWKEPPCRAREGEDLIIQLNDLLVQNYVLIPLINRATVSSAVGNESQRGSTQCMGR